MIDIQLTPEYRKSLDTLQALSSDLQKKGVKTALRAAALPLVAAEQLLAPDDERTPGSRLKTAINRLEAKPGRKVRTGKGERVIKREEDEISILVGPNKGKVSYIGWFTEKGTKPHSLLSRKNTRVFRTLGRTIPMHPGSKAQNWTEKSLATVQGQMEGLFYDNLTKWIAKNGR